MKKILSNKIVQLLIIVAIASVLSVVLNIVKTNEYNGQDVFKGNYPENDIGDTVTVWYDPYDASRVMRSDKKPDAGLWTYVPFIFAIPISIFVLSGGYKPRTRSLV